jgi:hypothetical protein
VTDHDASGQPPGSVGVETPAASFQLSTAEVRVVMQAAIDELAAMPAEKAREMVEKLVQLSGHSARTSNATGTITVHVEDGATVHDEGFAEVLRLGDAYAVNAFAGAPRLAYLVERNSVVRDYVVATGAALTAGVLLLFLQQQLQAPSKPATEYHFHYHAAPVPAQVEPALKQPPPPGDVCLPSDEPSKK